MSQYWVANHPGSTVTSSEAEIIAVLGRNLESTSVAALIGAGSTILEALTSQIGTVAKAQNLGKVASTVAGAVDVKEIRWTSAVADPTRLMNVTISPTSRVLVTTAQATANGVVCGGGSTDTVGQIKLSMLTSTGGSVNRYILLYSS
jgi:hypothetical protein